MKKGFTLIELLAVIVILAIIALIATPIILNIINDAKRESNERSIDMYANAIKQAAARYQMNSPTNEYLFGEFTTTDGKTLTNESGKTLNVDYDGPEVVCSTISINEDGSINLAGCTVDDTSVDYKYGIDKDELGATSIICKAATSSTYGTVPAGDGTFKVGDEYSCDPGDGIERTFYVLEDGDNRVVGSELTTKQVDLILDKNYDDTTLPWCEKGVDNSCNADGLTAKLNEIRSVWTNVEVDLPTANQVLAPDGYVVDTYSYGDINSAWLNINLEHEDIQGYWTKTPYNDDTTKAWMMNLFMKRLCEDGVNVSEAYGIRPVITVSKGQIK